MPFSLGKLRWHGALTPDAWAWVRATGREGHRVLDVVISDGRGEVLVEIEALAGRRLASSGEAANPPRTMPISLWAERWVDASETNARNECPDNVDTDTRWTIRWDDVTGLEALRDGAILVVIILFLFLMNLRTTFITLTAIPLSIVMTAVVFAVFGLSGSTSTTADIFSAPITSTLP